MRHQGSWYQRLYLVNKMLLYSEISWTDKDISQASYFIKQIDNYLIPFSNKAIDGDLRYNFTKNYSYLTTFITDYTLLKKLINIQELDSIVMNLDESERSKF